MGPAKTAKKPMSKLERKSGRLIFALEHGENEFVLQSIMSGEAQTLNCSSMLLHHALKFPHLNEPNFLAVLGADPGACSVPDEDTGYLPLHLMAVNTAKPTVTMVRALLAEYAGAASVPAHSGWLPLHLFAKHSTKRDNLAEILCAVRAAFPEASVMNAPGNYAQRTMKRTPDTLLTGVNEECERVLNLKPAACVANDLAARDRRHVFAEGIRLRCEAAIVRSDAVAMRLALQEAKGQYSGITDFVEPLNMRLMIHTCFERCERIDEASFDEILQASPIAPFQADDRGLLPIHILLSCSNQECLTSGMIKKLVEANPASLLTCGGPRGWLPLHFMVQRPTLSRGVFADANLPVLDELLLKPMGKQGRKAAKVKSQQGDLPIHAFLRRATLASLDAIDVLTSPGELHANHGELTWDCRVTGAMCTMLLEAYPDCLNETSTRDGLTCMQLAPPEMQDEILGFSARKRAARRQLADYDVEEEDVAEIDPREHLCALLDANAKVAKIKEIFPSCDLADPYKWDGMGGKLLHRLFRRKQDKGGVSTELFRFLLREAPYLAGEKDDENWYPLHLFAHRAVSDTQLGTPTNARRLTAAYKDATSAVGGHYKNTPLHMICSALARKPPLQGDDAERVIGVMRVLCDQKQISTTGNTSGKTPAAMLPNNSSFDIFREACEFSKGRRASSFVKPTPIVEEVVIEEVIVHRVLLPPVEDGISGKHVLALVGTGLCAESPPNTPRDDEDEALPVVVRRETNHSAGAAASSKARRIRIARAEESEKLAREEDEHIDENDEFEILERVRTLRPTSLFNEDHTPLHDFQGKYPIKNNWGAFKLEDPWPTPDMTPGVTPR